MTVAAFDASCWRAPAIGINAQPAASSRSGTIPAAVQAVGHCTQRRMECRRLLSPSSAVTPPSVTATTATFRPVLRSRDPAAVRSWNAPHLVATSSSRHRCRGLVVASASPAALDGGQGRPLGGPTTWRPGLAALDACPGDCLDGGQPEACQPEEHGIAQIPDVLKLAIQSAALLILAVLVLVPLALPALATGAQAAEAGTVAHNGGIGQRIAQTLRQARWPDEVILFLVAMLPIVELRGAIPVGHWMGLPPLYTFALAVAGNMVPVPFVLKYLGSISDALTSRSEAARKFFDWLFTRTRSKSDLLVKYRALGLALFVAVPLPLTGAWSGAIGAYMLDLPFWESMLANLVGVMGAGVIMTILCQLGWTGAVIAGVALFGVAIGAFREMIKKGSEAEAEGSTI